MRPVRFLVPSLSEGSGQVWQESLTVPNRAAKWIPWAGVLIGVCASGTSAKLVVLQHGVFPATSPGDCADTWISNEKWEQNRDQGRSPTLRVGGQRNALLRFDL